MRITLLCYMFEVRSRRIRNSVSPLVLDYPMRLFLEKSIWARPLQFKVLAHLLPSIRRMFGLRTNLNTIF